MRDIKFRAWHVENKTMVNFDNKKVIKDQYQMAHLCELIAGTHKDGCLMQFTGLTDKNGVDIYEGDIISREKNCMYSAGRQNEEVGFAGCAFTSGDADLQNVVDSFDAEVIGNIHENQELI